VTRLLLSWGPAALWAGLIFYLSSQSDLSAMGGWGINDKLAHFLLFAVFGGTLAWAGRHLDRTSFHAGLVLFGILYAAADEWHQSFVPMRDPSGGDLLADLAGVILGYVAIRTVLKALRGSKATDS